MKGVQCYELFGGIALKNHIFSFSLYICAWFGLCWWSFLKMYLCVFKKVKLINNDCLPILMLLYILLYIVLAYLMLFAALTNAVCLYNASFFAIDFCKCFLFSCFVFVY